MPRSLKNNFYCITSTFISLESTKISRINKEKSIGSYAFDQVLKLLHRMDLMGFRQRSLERSDLAGTHLR
jgi:hypothetical protein